MKPNERKALELLHDYTGGTFDVYRLIGQICNERRAAILTALTGHPVPWKKAGINALRVAMWSLCRCTDYTCHADYEQKFITWAKKQFDVVDVAPADKVWLFCHACDEDYEVPENVDRCPLCEAVLIDEY